tara:strand:+ start:573 stop:1091 length:519 start_codon:yes stop_codon:yes gene_type:complete
MSRFYGYADFGGGGKLCDKVADLLDKLDADDDDEWARELLEAVLASDAAKKLLKQRCDRLREEAIEKLKEKASEKLGTGQSSGKKSPGTGQSMTAAAPQGRREGRKEDRESKKAERAAKRASASVSVPASVPTPFTAPSPAPVAPLPPVKKSATPILVGGGSVLLLLAGLFL